MSDIELVCFARQDFAPPKNYTKALALQKYHFYFLLKKQDDNWYVGSTPEGRRGLIPSLYVHIIRDADRQEYFIATTDIKSKTSNKTFKVKAGQGIKLIARVTDTLWSGETCDSQVGTFSPKDCKPLARLDKAADDAKLQRNERAKATLTATTIPKSQSVNLNVSPTLANSNSATDLSKPMFVPIRPATKPPMLTRTMMPMKQTNTKTVFAVPKQSYSPPMFQRVPQSFSTVSFTRVESPESFTEEIDDNIPPPPSIENIDEEIQPQPQLQIPLFNHSQSHSQVHIVNQPIPKKEIHQTAQPYPPPTMPQTVNFEKEERKKKMNQILNAVLEIKDAMDKFAEKQEAMEHKVTKLEKHVKKLEQSQGITDTDTGELVEQEVI